MASSDNQGLQIALIIFVMLTIILSVTTFLFFRSYDEASTNAASATTRAQEAQTAATTAQSDLNDLKVMVGVPEATNKDAIQRFHTDDMKNYAAANIPQDKRSYRQALEYVFNAMQDSERKASAATAATVQLTEYNKQREQIKQKEIDQAVAGQKAAEADLAKMRDQYNTDREKLTRERDDLLGAIQKKQQEMEALTASTNQQVEQLKGQIAQLDQLLKTRNSEIDSYRTGSFEVADGEIRRVDQKLRQVWINLGSADGLRRQVTFSVYGADENGVARQERKGSIEVIDVIDQHFAAAKILEDTLVDPILPGDRIYTPLWHPGRGEHFAIAGRIDLDKDGRDDRVLLRDLIRMAGGTIDAEVDAAGKRTGKMTVNTRYLIEGEPPVVGETNATDQAAVAPYADILQEAERFGVQRIKVNQFLDHIGWKDTKRVLRFGPEALPDEFLRPRESDARRPTSRGAVSELFQKRQPLAPLATPGTKPAPK